MFVFTLIVVCLLCLAFDSTILAGLAGLALLSLLYPPLLIVLLVLFFIHQK
jgi:hypothetical protein